jgi:hypothetical protein
LKRAGISDSIIIEPNDSGGTFDEIADFLDRYQSRFTSTLKNYPVNAEAVSANST